MGLGRTTRRLTATRCGHSKVVVCVQSTPGQGQRLGLGLWSGVRVRVRGRVKGRVRVRVRGRVRGTVRVRVVWVQSTPKRRSTSAMSILAEAPLY